MNDASQSAPCNDHSTRYRIFNSTLLIIILLLAFASPSIAQPTLLVNGAPATKPLKAAKFDSLIVTSDGKWLWDSEVQSGIMATDFPAMLNSFPGPTIDVLMQQCFGGGFAPGLDDSNPKFTLTAAANWNEVATNVPMVGTNFTNSWNQSFPRTEGLYQHYLDATNGAAAVTGPPAQAAVTPDPYGPKGDSRTAKFFEDPLFASSDPYVDDNADPKGVNNSRGVVADDTYALLMAPESKTNGVESPRYATNIDKIYQSLRSINIPANHIIVLYGGNAANTATAGGTPINGPATLANITTATSNGTNLYGNITGQTSPGNPDTAAHFFVYATGHGHSWDSSGAVGKAYRGVNPAGNLSAAGSGSLDISVTDMPANSFVDADGSDSGIGTVDLQLASRASDLGGVPITLDGIPEGVLLPEPTPEMDLTPVIGPSYYYDVSVPLSDLDSLPSTDIQPIDIQLTDVSDSDLSDTLVSAVTFDDYGDSWSVGVVPEPATTSLILIGAVAMLNHRRRATGI